jgi:hypothetical protein
MSAAARATTWLARPAAIATIPTGAGRGRNRQGRANAMRIENAIRCLLTAAASLGAAGCGYQNERPFRQDVKTVAVEIFDSKEFRRGLELQLAEALAKRIEAETPYKLAKRETADSLLTGEVKEVRQATLGRSFQNTLPRETAATMTVAFQWKDLRNGEMLVQRDAFTQTVDYVPPLNETFYHASQRICDRMAERIVEEMEAPW